ncbi:MAG: histidine kinase, partial [Gemmatimonadota bacterium]|nr:histidine kinase [Gemmatimonadota bacterium]
SLALVPVVVGLRLFTARWDRPELAGLVVDLGSAPGELQPAVATALEDPSVQVLHTLDGERLLDEGGRAVTEADLVPDRSLTRIQSGERLIGGLVHDAALRQDAARLTAVVAAIGLALDVNRLNTEVTAQLDEVQASRRRIIEAGDAARQRVERDLHDGAQQRLVAVGMDLQRAKRQAETKGEYELAELLDSATSDVRRALDEIRLVSRGFHPSLLAERGLGAAVEALAERSPVPVRTEVASAGVPAAIEKTAYYVVAEGLTNVAKHARAAEASVRIALEDGTLQVVVSDDGAGEAAIRPGSGLQGLEDRVVAEGGRLTVQSGPAGTTLTAVIPCE